MKKLFFTLSACAALALALTLLFFPLKYAWAADVSPFQFLIVTDSHLGDSGANRNTPRVVSDMTGKYPGAAFAVHMGDITETGDSAEYQIYQSLFSGLPYPIYLTMGNHESRWNDPAHQRFTQITGQPPTQSWDYGGIHFVMLDSSIPKGQNGHLSRQDLAWLTADLAGIAPDTPVVLFTHHPLLYDEGRYNTVYLDDDQELWPLLESRNIIALFSGHGHIHLYWEVNGVSGMMIKAAMEEGYAAVDVDPARGILNVQAMALSQGELGETVSAPQATWEIPLKRNPPAGLFQITSPAANTAASASLLVQARFDWEIMPAKVEYRLGISGWRPLPALVNQPGLYERIVDLSDTAPGARTLWVRAMTSDERSFVQSVPLTVNRPELPVQKLWEFQANGPIQANPSVNENCVYAGDRAGFLYAVARNSGEVLWTAQAGGPILASPVLKDQAVYAADTLGNVFAWDAATGQPLWQQACQESIAAGPASDDSRLYLASTDGSVMALDILSGQVLWKQTLASKAIISAPAVGDSLLYFGSWDNYLYAARKDTGELVWKQPLGSQIYYAPAAASPLFYRGKIYISTPGNLILCLDAVNGAELWSVKASSGLSTPIVYNNAIVYSTLDGTLYALDPDTGANLWQVDHSQSNFGSSPVAQEGSLLLSGLTGNLASVHVNSYAVSWNIHVDDAYIFSDPAVWQNQIYIGTLSGKLAAYAAVPGEAPVPFPGFAFFPDTAGHWARTALNALSQKNWIRGFEDGTYRPDDPVTRGQLAAMIARVLGTETPPAGFVSQFTDLESHWASAAVMALESDGKAPGYAADADPQAALVFRPDQPATRAEAALFLALAISLSEVSDPFFPGKFTDIAGIPAEWAVKALESRGFIGGFLENGVSYYKPDNNLTRAEIGALLMRIFH
jgi:outer membrane protein assembly factor BamB